MVEIANRLRGIAADLGANAPLAERLQAVGLAALDPQAEAAAAAAVAAARRFLLLDLRHVTGIDATTASAFASLRRSLEARCDPPRPPPPRPLSGKSSLLGKICRPRRQTRELDGPSQSSWAHAKASVELLQGLHDYP